MQESTKELNAALVHGPEVRCRLTDAMVDYLTAFDGLRDPMPGRAIMARRSILAGLMLSLWLAGPALAPARADVFEKTDAPKFAAISV